MSITVVHHIDPKPLDVFMVMLLTQLPKIVYPNANNPVMKDSAPSAFVMVSPNVILNLITLQMAQNVHVFQKLLHAMMRHVRGHQWKPVTLTTFLIRWIVTNVYHVAFPIYAKMVGVHYMVIVAAMQDIAQIQSIP